MAYYPITNCGVCNKELHIMIPFNTHQYELQDIVIAQSGKGFCELCFARNKSNRYFLRQHCKDGQVLIYQEYQTHCVNQQLDKKNQKVVTFIHRYLRASSLFFVLSNYAFWSKELRNFWKVVPLDYIDASARRLDEYWQQVYPHHNPYFALSRPTQSSQALPTVASFSTYYKHMGECKACKQAMYAKQAALPFYLSHAGVDLILTEEGYIYHEECFAKKIARLRSRNPMRFSQKYHDKTFLLYQERQLNHADDEAQLSIQEIKQGVLVDSLLFKRFGYLFPTMSHMFLTFIYGVEIATGAHRFQAGKCSCCFCAYPDVPRPPRHSKPTCKIA